MRGRSLCYGANTVADQHNISSALADDEFSHRVQRRLARFRVLGRLCTVLGMVMLAAMAVIGLGTSVVPRVLGLHSYAIVSGSMEPTYPTGSLVYTKPIAGAEVQPGAVVAFWRGEDVVVHRALENNTAESELVTKGDANEEPDVRPVPYANVLGEVVASVPGVGYVLMGFADTAGKLVLGWILLMALAFCVVGVILTNLVQRETE